MKVWRELLHGLNHSMTKFKVGDQVLTNPDRYYDNKKHNGIVVDAHQTQGIDMYSLHFPDGYGGKRAWYNNNELELVYRPNYT